MSDSNAPALLQEHFYCHKSYVFIRHGHRCLSGMEVYMLKNKQKNGLDLNMNFYELFEIFNGGSVPSEKPAPASMEDYLHKGERILSLLRERKRKEFHAVPFLDALVPKTYFSKNTYDRQAYVLQCMRNKVLRPITDKIVDGQTDLGEILRQLPGMENCMQPAEPEKNAILILKGLCKDDYKGCIAVEVKGFEKIYAPTGGTKLPAKTHGAGFWMLKKDRNHRYAMADMSAVFSSMALFCQLRREIRMRWENLSPQELEDDILHKTLEDALCDAIAAHEVYTGKGGKSIVLFENEDFPYVRKYFQDLGYEVAKYENVPKQEKEILFPFEKREAMKNSSYFGAILFLADELPVSDMELKFRHLRTGKRSYQQFLDAGISTELMVMLIDKMIYEYEEDKQEEKIRKANRESYAASFETKHNIPQKILRAMEASEFNNYFGYVEFDEEVDLSLMKSVYEEFHALAKFMGLNMHEEVSLRFRKLGNHKATGLYYLYLKCLCVDVRHPASFAHECMHMLDYEHGHVSRGAAFYPVLALYREEVKRSVENLGYSLKGKYDLDYYLEPSEAFARCGEIYLTRICGIRNSVVEPDPKNDFAYPDNIAINDRIRSYFNSFFNK